MIELGEKVKDKVTGFVGIATSRVDYLNGCVQYGITPKMKKGESKKPVASYIDIEQLISLEKKVIIKKKNSGGFQPDHPSH